MKLDPRRESLRKRHLSEVHIDGVNDGADPIRISDLSTKGAFLDTRCQLPIGSIARLAFTIRRHPISVAARIVYCSPPFGIGVRFLDLSPEDRALIEML